jgi:alpha-acetolactate decarboxylase
MAAEPADVWDGKLVQYGKMHEAIGMQQHQARVRLEELQKRPHFYGVAALAGLAGEVTIVDGKITLTEVDAQGGLKAIENAAAQREATLLVGAYVPSWTQRQLTATIEDDRFDETIASLASQAGLKTSEPFPFVIEGTFSNVRLHVINGACPLHARLRKIDLPKQHQPFEAVLEKVRGTLVGIYAQNAVGNITHPATATHRHLLFKDAASGKVVTGHVEQAGVLTGAVVRLPKQ